jgi:endonuclease YncB( thermonuclease family)
VFTDLNFKTVYRIFLVALFLVVFVSMSRYVGSLFGPQFDAVDTCSYVVDGDTFDVSSGHRIRLADVDAPERGEYGFDEATNYVGDMIYGKTVYLDLDDVNMYDTTATRLVSVVYVEVEPGTHLNLNQALLDHGLANGSEHSQTHYYHL